MRAVKRLQSDARGSERLFGVFVFFGTFIAISAILIANMSTMFAWSEMGSFTYDSRRIQVGSLEYTMINATYGIQTGNLSGFYSATWDDVQSYWNDDDEDNFYYHDDVNDDDLQLAMLRDTSYTGHVDYIYIFERWGWWSTELSYMTYSQLEDAQVPGHNVSVKEFDSHGKTYSLIIITPSDYLNHTYYLEQNIFWIGISYDPYDPDNMATTSLWGILGQMLTASLPGVHPAIQYFLLIPIWTGISFLFFTLISRVIPFISGG